MFADGALVWAGENGLGAKVTEVIVGGINNGLGVLLPIGIGIMATFIGIHLIKRIVYTFL